MSSVRRAMRNRKVRMQGCFCPNLKVPKGLEILFQDLNCLFELRRKSSIFFIARHYIFPGAQISTIADSCLVDTCNPEPGDGMHCTVVADYRISPTLSFSPKSRELKAKAYFFPYGSCDESDMCHLCVR